MKGNVLILSNNIGGLYCFRKEVIQGIKDNGYEVYISYPDLESSFVPYFKEMGCHLLPTLFDLRGVNPLAEMKLLLTYLKLIKRTKPIAVLTYTIKPNIYGGIACRMKGVPLLANITGLGDAVENGGLMQKMTLFLYKLGISKSYQTFFQNTANRSFFINKGIASEESVLLPGSGVNIQHHKYQNYPKDGPIVILYVGSTKKDKGTDELFAASRIIKERHPEVRFQLLGNIENGYDNEFTDLVNQNVFEFLGHTDDVRPFIGNAHCTIMPSYHEGMSNANLEGAANGRPVITTDVPGCRETVDDSKTGIIVRAKDTRSLVDGIERFLSLTYEQKKAMGIMARKKMENEFDRQIVVDAYVKEIESISNV